jgi:HlyD family secretion protein
MNKWLVTVLVILIIVNVIAYVGAKVRVALPGMEPKFGEVTRGDIRVPISASGLIEPKQRIEVKSKASGEVIEVRVEEGDFVRKGDTLVILKRDDELRNKQRAEADLARAKALLRQSELAVERAKVNVTSAQARLDEMNQQIEIAKYDVDKNVELQKMGVNISNEEVFKTEANYKLILAQRAGLAAALENAKLAVQDAEQAVITNSATVQTAQTTLGDAEERLEETVVIATHDAIVTEVNVTEGAIIQAGQSTFTGGTVIARLAVIVELKVVARVDEAEYGRVLAISPEDALPEMQVLEESAQQSAQEIETQSGEVNIRVDAFPDQTFTGRIIRVEPQGKLNAGASVIQYDVHVLITDEKRHQLLLGSQAQVEFMVETATDVLRVPAEAVKTNGEQRGLFVQAEPATGTDERWGKRFIPVMFGITDGTNTEISQVLGGETLEAGQKVYTKLPQTPRGDD